MPKFRMRRKSREQRDAFPSAASDISVSPSDSLEIRHHHKINTPHDSAQDLSDRLSNMAVHTSKGRSNEQQVLHRKSSLRTGHMVRSPPPPVPSDVLVVGAGPTGLMLTSHLIRFGINAEIIDNRSERTATGRADGLQPKTIETLKQMRIADRIMLKGVKVNDIRLWMSGQNEPLQRIAKETMYPPEALDCLDPFLLLAHQGFVEDLLLKDMMERGVDVHRNVTFVDYYKSNGPDKNIEVLCKSAYSDDKKIFAASYLVGCDGAHSNVRKSMGARMVGSSYDQIWGVIDGEIETDFPDIYSKTVIHNKEAGTMIVLPRERGMTRLHIELSPQLRDVASREKLSQEFVINIAREIFEPYQLRFQHIEWFGRYQIGQKISSKFQDDEGRVFLVGDATHTQSPNASQGMNSAVHDAVNLAWKLNLTIRGLAKPCLLKTYEQERRQVAEDMLGFDYEHTNTFSSGDLKALSDDFQRSARFTSGYGADLPPNVLNVQEKGSIRGLLRAGSFPPPAKVTRHFDSNPVDIQLDIPLLGQFRIYYFVKNLEQVKPFMEELSAHALSYTSVLGKLTYAANASYTLQPPIAALSDEFTRPERYTTVSGMFTFALVLEMNAADFELDQLPKLWRNSRYTVYADDVAHLDTRCMSCTDKWLGGLRGSEVGIVILRPDGYVGTVGRFIGRSPDSGAKATKWLDDYFDAFLLSGF
ncbi:hypothetical protein, variant [Verruconis gallopava]|uniref:FAD-binding domain-containing protein n=1 Tax=Verruconis gallopava TaxID=253628 RepID=A0A0D2AXT3_9PEZI|nr:hypothetical protein, variant [Verruconis gallopava]KIW03959.1 hypothetical protein, variant [Verruconis gallopava]